MPAPLPDPAGLVPCLPSGPFCTAIPVNRSLPAPDPPPHHGGRPTAEPSTTPKSRMHADFRADRFMNGRNGKPERKQAGQPDAPRRRGNPASRRVRLAPVTNHQLSDGAAAEGWRTAPPECRDRTLSHGCLNDRLTPSWGRALCIFTPDFNTDFHAPFCTLPRRVHDPPARPPPSSLQRGTSKPAEPGIRLIPAHSATVTGLLP